MIGSTSAGDVLRTYQNKDEIERHLIEYIEANTNADTNLIVQGINPIITISFNAYTNHYYYFIDLSKLPFEEQIKLLASTSIIIGMHGTAMASTMHMPIGMTIIRYQLIFSSSLNRF